MLFRSIGRSGAELVRAVSITCVGPTRILLNTAFSRYWIISMTIVIWRGNLTFSLPGADLWRAVCGKTTCTVRREGRVTPAPTPICASIKMPRSNLKQRSRGGSSTSEQICADVELPPRPRLFSDAFGDIFLTARPPRLARRGDRAPSNAE